MSEKVLKLELSVDETNLILEALGTLPYVKVYGLISRIQQQAQAQLRAQEGAVQEQSAQQGA